MIIQNNHKNTFPTNHDSISSKVIAKQQVVTLYMVTPEGQVPKFGQKITPNIGNMQITSQFGPHNNTK